MKLGWKDFAVIFGLIVLVAVVIMVAVKESVEVVQIGKTSDGQPITANVVKKHLFKVKSPKES